MERVKGHIHRKKIKRSKKTEVSEPEKKEEEIKDDEKNQNPEEEEFNETIEISVEDEIEAIFQKMKKDKEKKKSEGSKKEEKKRIKGRKYTEDGLPIYTEEELGMNNPKAGTTPLCPFDCDCCH